MASRSTAKPTRPSAARAKAAAGGLSPLAGLVLSGFLLTALGAAIIQVRGDPFAGVPVVQAPLLTPQSPPAPQGWTEALKAADPEAGRTVMEPVTVFGGAVQGEVSEGKAAAPVSPNSLKPPATLHGQSMLAPAPISGLYGSGPDGPLPVIAKDGRTSASAYARPFSANGKPKLALIIGRLGQDANLTRQAIETLPGEVTLSFVPYASGLQGWIDLARQHGHEVLIEVPMEPLDYPANDPGPYTLLAAAPAKDTVARLEWILSRATGYFGVSNAFGSRFVNAQAPMETVLTNLRKRGLAFIDDGSAMASQGGLMRASADKVLDDQSLSPDAIGAQFLALEQTARRQGQALGKGSAYPVTVAQARQWIGGLERRGFQLAPASALASQR